MKRQIKERTILHLSKTFMFGALTAIMVLAATTARGQGTELNLIPRPREVKETLPASGQAAGAAFRVTQKTKIVVEKDLGADFAGAKMLADEIEGWTGWRLKISNASGMLGGSDFIYIGSVAGDSKLRAALASQGLSMPQGFDEQGYAIAADGHRILVGGASEQGAFYGVQTLRQLLRPINDQERTADSSPPSTAKLAVAGLPSTSPAVAGKLRAGGMTTQTKGVDEIGAPESRNRTSLSPVSLRLGDTPLGALPSTSPAVAGKLRAGGMTTKNKDGAENVTVGELVCPGVAIRDWPAMKWRGVHVDLSRGPILSLDYMKEQVRVLSAYKINMYALYMEDVFELPDEPIAAPQRGALTPEEMKELVAYAKQYYVTIVPELETFGHLHNVLRYDLYSQLAEIPHGAVLTPTQTGTYDFLGKMIADIAPSFPGPFFHIGADETFQLGEGQTKQLIAQKGEGQVYLDHIVKLDEMLKPYHKQTMFWADIAEHSPQLLPTLPKDLIAVVWEYSPQPDYEKRLAPFKNASLPIFVSPGVSDWNQIYPDFNAAYQNIRNLTRDGQKFGALGMLNTEWNDYGERLSGMLWPGFVYGAACAWQAGESSTEQFKDSYDWAFYRNSDHTFMDALDKLAATNTLLGGMKLGAAEDSYFWEDMFSRGGANDAEMAAPVTHEMRVDAEQAWASLAENRAKARLHADSIEDLIFAARRLDGLGMKFEYTQEMSELYWDAYTNMSDRASVARDLERISSTNGRLQDLREMTTELRAAYEQRWRAENGGFWLGNVMVRYDALAAAIQSKILGIDAIEQDFSRGGVLPTPESEGFYLRAAGSIGTKQ